MKYRVGSLIFLFWAPVLLAGQETEHSPNEAVQLRAAVDVCLEPYVASSNFSGSVLISSEGKTLIEAGYGMANIEHAAPNNPQTRFVIASISKTFTAAAVLLLQDRGVLSVDDPVSRFAPDFPNGDTITIHQLLTHTSGLPRFVFQPDYAERSRLPHKPEDLVGWVRDLPPAFAPGERVGYSNANYAMLAYIVEAASGTSFGDFLQANFFDPLRLRNTGNAGDARAIIPNLASGYMPSGVTELEKARYYDYSTDTGSGSIYSTTHDLFTWFRALRYGKLLSPDSRALMFPSEGDAESYGWLKAEMNGRSVIEKSGWDGVGFAAKFVHFEDDDLTVIVLSNLNISNITSEIARRLAAIAMGEECEALSITGASLEQSTASELAGSYRFGPDFYVPGAVMQINAREGGLAVEGDPPGGLLPVSDTEFIHRQHWFRVSFLRDESGRVTRMKYDRFEAHKETEK